MFFCSGCSKDRSDESSLGEEIGKTLGAIQCHITLPWLLANSLMEFLYLGMKEMWNGLASSVPYFLYWLSLTDQMFTSGDERNLE